ncbi:MAG: VCBS repeat-containing protein, partial [Myxococcota bacterium]|nr:VCBS repeat-containing protein [Myxococcota bacterium]
EVVDLIQPSEDTFYTSGGGGLIPVGLIDSDRNGIQELVVAAEELLLFEIHEPFVLTQVDRPTVELPGFRIRDIAAADLNNDGWPDMVLSGMCFGTNASGQLSGGADLVFMNTGGGYFEMSKIKPERYSMTNGITAADVDGDGWVDLMESIDVSSIISPDGNYGPGRLLMNRTKPGDRYPTWEVSDAVIDTGASGMGFCVDDLDQDGYVDLYNTSIALDQLMMGLPDGGFIDQTIERGIVHEYGPAGQRMQWSPSFVDFNMDGRLDIFVREGGFGLEGEMQMSGMEGMDMGMEDIVSSEATDLIYLQQTDGYFVRSDPPENLGSGGRQGTVGDMNADGRPDIGLGGLPGTLGVFVNETPVEPGTRYFGVRFKTTASAWPPTGAHLTGTCGDHSMTRIISSGGKQGGCSTVQEFFSFPDCDEQPVVKVVWPSGAHSSHTVADGLLDVLLEEPAWCATEGKVAEVVTVNPGVGGGTEACVGAGLNSTSCCSVADGSCDLDIPFASKGESAWLRLDDGPKMALPRRDPFWALITEPSPPRPGEPVTLHAIHAGDPADIPEGTISLFVNGSPVSWESTDMDATHPILSATVQLPSDVMSMDVALFPVTFPDPTWTVHFNHIFDNRMLVYEQPIARKVTGGVTELWDWMAFIIGRRGFTYVEMMDTLQVSRPDGSAVPWAVIFETKTMGRMQVVVNFDDIGDTDTLIVHDGDPSMGMWLPVMPPKDLESVVPTIGGFRGGLMRTRISRNRDVAQISVTLQDHDGLLLPPEDGLFTLEIGGAEVQQMKDMGGGGMGMMGVSMGSSLFLVTDPDWPEDEGYAKIIAADGRIVGTAPFWLRPQAKKAASVVESEASIEIPFMQMIETAGTHEVKVKAKNYLGELVGSEVDISLEVHGGTVESEMANQSFGAMTAMVKADPGVENLKVDVYLDGEFFTKLETKIDNVVPLPEDETDPEEEDGPTIIPPSPPDEIDDTVAEDTPTDDTTPDEPAPTPVSDSGGCSSSQGPLSLGWALLAMGLLLMVRRRSLVPFGSRRAR